MSRPDIEGIEARAEADGPGEPYVCRHCEEPYDPARECAFGGGECEEPDADDVCREDRGALLAYVRELEAERERWQAERARLLDLQARGLRLEGDALLAWMQGSG